jgi:hypothetical protein
VRRRELLHLALFLSGASTCGAAARAVLDAAPPASGGRPAALAPGQRAMVAALAELVIPATDTPGAIEARVPAFIESVVTHWYDERERRIFTDGLEALDAWCARAAGSAFLDATQDLRLAALREAEREATERRLAGGGADGDAPFFYKLKELTVVGYYTSEIGATRELRYDPVPLHYDGSLPFQSVGRQWSH